MGRAWVGPGAQDLGCMDMPRMSSHGAPLAHGLRTAKGTWSREMSENFSVMGICVGAAA